MNIDFPSEKVIEDFVCCHLDRGHCPISNERISGYLRQHKIDSYGITDVIKIHANPGGVYFTILELKNQPLNESHLCQLSRYMVGLKNQVARYEKRFKTHIEVYGELAGPFDSSKSDFAFLLDHISEDIFVYELTLDLNKGFKSERQEGGWRMTNANLVDKKLARKCIHLMDMERKDYAELAATKVTNINKNRDK